MANLGYIQVVRVCNQSCRFCSNPENGRELSLADACRLIDGYKDQGYDGVIITGGEPTLYPHLAEVIRYARMRDMAARLITNGQKTAERAYLVSLVEAGLSHMHVSLHSHKPAMQAFLSGNRDSLTNIARTLTAAGRLPLTVDINQTICKQNADHIDASVRWICEHFPFVRHFSWTYLDPYMNRVAEHPDVVPRLADSERSLLAAFRYLDESGRTFRIEKLPLCYMGDYAHCSTETRALVKNEERTINFLDERADVQERMWYYGKALTCKTCSLEAICAGLWDIGYHFDPDELRPQTRDPEAIVRRILEDP
jgi:MoaA/NifB/PqqE/SkfB family radical SAM enzyme